MHAPETIRNKDLEICLNDCQQRQYPFTFWDEEEVAGFDLGHLPTLAKEPARDWALKGEPIIVDLSKADSVRSFKAHAQKTIAEGHPDDTQIAFAITSDQEDRKGGPLVTIQTYFR